MKRKIEAIKINDIQRVVVGKESFLEVDYSATSQEAGEHFPEALRAVGIDARRGGLPSQQGGRRSFSMSDLPADKYEQIFRKSKNN